jgi:protein-tyrosine phosphatase
MSRADPLARHVPGGWRARIHRYSTRLYGPDPATSWLTWIADERIAIGALPTAATIARLAAEGVTHVVNCRARVETLLSQDLAVERALFGKAHVVQAPMWDTGRRKHPRRWSAAARFVARVLDEDATARVLIHCKAGCHRSVLVAYAALRLRHHSADDAASLIVRHRAEAELLPAYRASVDDWIGEGSAGLLSA